MGIIIKLFDYIISGYNDELNFLITNIIIIVSLLGIFLSATNTKKFIILKDTSLYLCGILGIFGTFLGIYIGLDNFDTKNISQSIPHLLDGMKIAFYTSIVGMFFTILLKVTYSFFDSLYLEGTDDEFLILKNIEKNLEKTATGILELTTTLNNCFKSDEEYSLISQVKLIRQEMIDGRRELSKVFNEFMEQFSKMASESLVNELKTVVDKFNVMLNDLVSQSFIDLKDSTERLNQWQSEHKELMEKQHTVSNELYNKLSELYTLYQDTEKRIVILSEHFQQIDSNLQSITLSSNDLEKSITEIGKQNIILENAITEIHNIGEKAQEVIPSIASSFAEIKGEVLNIQKLTHSFMQEQVKAINNSTEKNTTLIKQTMDTATKDLSNLTKETDSFVKTIISDYIKNSEEINEQTQKQVEKIDQALEKELTKSLESFAGMMVTLSQKFVSDYQPLTEKLRELVQLSEKIK